MPVPHKPEGYSAVSPYLIVNGATGTIDFAKNVFGASELRRFEDGEGRVIHAEVKIDDSVVMIADSANDWPALASHVHVFVEDVDTTFAKALAAGGEAVQEPEKKDDEDRRGGVRDPGGTTWWIATRVE